MKGRIIKIDENQIVVRPLENFLDVIIDQQNYIDAYTDDLNEGQEVEITFMGSILITANGLKLYGKFEEE